MGKNRAGTIIGILSGALWIGMGCSWLVALHPEMTVVCFAIGVLTIIATCIVHGWGERREAL